MPSTVVAKILYEKTHARLTVTFTTGRTYEYYLVPAEVAAAFETADSKGRFFNTKIRDHYKFREITAAAR
jgi:KTSC domain